MRGFHALKMNKNTASSGISLSVNRLNRAAYRLLAWLLLNLVTPNLVTELVEVAKAIKAIKAIKAKQSKA